MIDLLHNKRGSMIIWAPVILIVGLMFGTSLFEQSRLTSIAQKSRDAVQAAMTEVCSDNSPRLYGGFREGYAGGYKLENTSTWTGNVTSGDILSKVDRTLGTAGGVKTSDGKLVYKISDFTVNIKNSSLAPADTDSNPQFSGTAHYTLTVPLSFGWSALPPMVTSIEVKSGYSKQGEIENEGSTGGDSGGTKVSGVKLENTSITLNKGDTDVLNASILPDDAEDRSLSWVSTNENICTVTQTGAVTGMNPGEAAVMVFSGSGQTARCGVTVVSPVNGISLDKSSVSMIQGASEQLNAAVSPDDASNKNVSWVSSNTSVCTVSSSGKITAAGAGQAVVSVMTQEGGYFAECAVTVTIPVSGISLDKNELHMAKGTADKLTASVYPSGAAQQEVLWASSNSSVCTVNQSGNISAVNAGTAVISATSKNGMHIASCKVTVTIPVTGISLDPSNLILIKGKSYALRATISPPDATDKNIFWVSSDSSVASVSGSGTVNANGSGSCTVTATTEDGRFQASCRVTVAAPVTGITLNPPSLVLNEGQSRLLEAAVSPSNATNQNMIWSSSDSSVASVSGSGTVYANSTGSCTVTATTEDGGFSAECSVTVKPKLYHVNLKAGPGGSVSGGGTYSTGFAWIDAKPDDGYEFKQWSDGSKEASRLLLLYNDITLTAEFSKIDIDNLFTIRDHYSGSGWSFIKDGCEIVGYSSTAEIQNVVIPSVIKGEKVVALHSSIDDNDPWYDGIFYSNHNVKTVTIPSSVKYIENSAFCDCDSITSIRVPNTVKYIGRAAFEGCNSLSSINIPNSVTKIEERAFECCHALTSIKIPNSVTEIKESAFRQCTSISSITIPASVTSVGNGAFCEWESNQTIYVHGKSSQSEADAAWGKNWRYNGYVFFDTPIKARIVYCG